MNERVYLAGPILHDEDDGRGWREYVKSHHTDIDWVDPLDHADESGGVVSREAAEAIVEQDLNLLDECHAMLVNWELVPTAGTPMEMFYMRSVRRKAVVVVWDGPDEDLSPWVRTYATDIIPTFEEAVERLHVVC